MQHASFVQIAASQALVVATFVSVTESHSDDGTDAHDSSASQQSLRWQTAVKQSCVDGESIKCVPASHEKPPVHCYEKWVCVTDCKTCSAHNDDNNEQPKKALALFTCTTILMTKVQHSISEQPGGQLS
jgi:hypothetical protein